MDYEAVHTANLGYKDRLDERDRELEKLRNKYVSSLSRLSSDTLNDSLVDQNRRNGEWRGSVQGKRGVHSGRHRV